MIHVGFGLLICLVAWLGLRASVGARLTGAPLRAAAIDAFPIAAGFALMLLGTARPVLAGLAIASLAIGLVVADRVKRAVLDEPVIFSDRAELLEVVRHPRLYIAFVGTARMIVGTLACLLTIIGLIWLEPPAWRVSPSVALGLALLAIVIARALFILPTAPPILARLARAYARLGPSRDPTVDAARFGLLATFLIHATIARAERAGRQRDARRIALPPLAADSGPILLIQAESFMDAGRLDPALAAHLPHFTALRTDALLHGTLTVPCWGANTIRSELAILTGIDGATLGLDRFNPYEAFARVALPSIAHQARAAGYHTICVHPYSATFYGRDKVMPLLGFDRFIGLEAFADAPRDGAYVSDVAVAALIAGLVRTHGPKLLVFAITMENHGPWDGAHDPLAMETRPIANAIPDGDQLARWLRQIERTDAMIPLLRDAIDQGDRPGWLLFYGDHQPSLPRAFAALGMTDRRSDYAIWTPARPPGGPCDLAAEQIATTLLRAMAA